MYHKWNDEQIYYMGEWNESISSKAYYYDLWHVDVVMPKTLLINASLEYSMHGFLYYTRTDFITEL